MDIRRIAGTARQRIAQTGELGSTSSGQPRLGSWPEAARLCSHRESRSFPGAMTSFTPIRRARLVAALLTAATTTAHPQSAAQRVDRAEHHEFVIANFRTEGGVTLPSARVVYGTYGRLNAARDNVVLLPSHYMANHHGYEWLIGPGQALDTARLFLVATELFGNGASSSPSNTPEPFHGPRFPVMTIRDNVEAVHRLLTEDLKVTHVRAIIGFSMGAQQAFQWAVSYPSFADRVVATSGTAKTYGHGIVRLEGQIAALTADSAFKGGEYTTPPKQGLAAFGMVWAAWLYSQEWWRRELWRTNSAPGTTFEQVMNGFRTAFRADANDYILQARTWQRHDVGTTPGMNGDVERALRSITAPLLYMPSETDLYFPIGDARYEAQFIPHVSLVPIPSLWGHPAGAGASPADRKFLNETIARFLAGEAVGTRPPRE
jgi:homoserine O-acetyltransferase/O-succinyltransferase